MGELLRFNISFLPVHGPFLDLRLKKGDSPSLGGKLVAEGD